MKIRVNGIPAPQGSKRAFKNPSTGRVNVVEASRNVGPWREGVRGECQRYMDRVTSHAHHIYDELDELELAELHQGAPAAVTLAFFLPRPKGHYGKGRNAGQLTPRAPQCHTTTPDVDKLARSTLDALKMAGVIRDDSQVCTLTAGKAYAGDREPPGCEITVERISRGPVAG